MEFARLIIDPPAAGDWNMAVDEALLTSADTLGIASVRLYRWSEPTLSLGYFQRWEDRGSHPASIHLPLVRRSTGGGAIVHHHEITYSVSLPSTNRWSKHHEDLYWQIHRAISTYLNAAKIPSELFNDRLLSPRDQEPFLCFQRRSAGDLTLDGFKILGSAQRRKRNALLQHGSLLLAQSERAPELPGLTELSIQQSIDETESHSIDEPLSVSTLVEIFAETLGLQLEPQPLSTAEASQVDRLIQQQRSDQWLKKR